MSDEPAEQIDVQEGLDAPVSPEQDDLSQADVNEIEAAELHPAVEMQSFRFLTDHNVPVSVGHVLTELGHDVARVSDVMPANSADPIVARAAIEGDRILISWDRDFNAQRFASPRFAELSRIMMSGPEPQGAARLRAVFDVVEFALLRSPGMPIIIRIGRERVQIHV